MRAGQRDDDSDDDGWSSPAASGPSRRAKLVYTIVVSVAMLGSIVLCCVAAGQAGQLLWLELPPP